MTWVEALVIGLVQGITEILPISSTAHILLLADIFQIPEPSIAATVFLNFGSFLAIIAFFRARWKPLIQGTWRVGRAYLSGTSVHYDTEDRKQAGYAGILGIATIPAVIAGLAFEDLIEAHLRSPLTIAGALIGGGLLLLLADIFPRRRSLHQMGSGRALFVGCFQALALIPGFSRSGSAITGGRFLSLQRSDAAVFAFLMGAPVLIAAMVYQLPVLIRSGALSSGSLWLAFAISAISTYGAIHFLMGFVAKRSYLWFVIYRALLGLVLLLIIF